MQFLIVPKFHYDPLNIVRVIAPTTLKMDNFDKFRDRLSIFHKRIPLKFELDLCFYVIIPVPCFHKDLLNYFRVIVQTTLKMEILTNSGADNSTSHQQISPNFELDLCFYAIILVLKFHNDPLNFVKSYRANNP